MFQSYTHPVKISILIVSFMASLVLGFYLFNWISISNHIVIQILLLFFLTWVIMFCPFMLFHSYKYIRLPQFFYEKRSFETAQYFEILGVQGFRKVLINSFFRYLNSRVYIKGKGHEYIPVFIEETRQSETSHIFTFILTLLVQCLFMLKGYFLLAFVLLLFNIIFNIYPILLQRMNRFYFEAKYSEFSL
ncbi:MAG: hypothetical protein OEW75_06785 [Cyclobacteriaceae bacterium]|nr:hypothetical protein [Cyclobacteriaceae bacterium]